MKALFALMAIVALASQASCTVFKIVPRSEGTEILFESDAPMETVVGKTEVATGFIELDPASTLETTKAEIHVDLGSISTGITLRDKHMRENHLETGRYPEAVFILTSMSQSSRAALIQGIPVTSEIDGTLELHGVTRTIRTIANLLLSDDGRELSVNANFTVLLSDYNIARPEFLIMRLSSEQRISVQLRAVQE